MLRVGFARSARCAEQAVVRRWQPQRIRQQWALGQRTLADIRTPDKTVLPGSQSGTVAGVPQTPILEAPTATATTEIPASNIPKPPPPAPSTNTGKLPPTGTGTASTGPASIPPPPPPKRPRRRFRNFLLSLVILTSLGYAGGVYYSLVNDNFHDFFTEYIPYGEDAVAYFEDREFRKRFPQPSKDYTAKNWPQVRGENKVTIGRSSGLSPRVADESDLGQKGRHTSALEDGENLQSGNAQQAPDSASAREKTQAVENAKKGKPASEAAEKQKNPLKPKSELRGDKAETVSQSDKNVTPAAPSTPAPAPTQPLVDHLNIPQATEPVVQDLVKMANNIITAVNASPEAAKFASTVQTMKGDLSNIISSISALKDSTAQEAETKLKNAHTDFDNAAKELVRRLEQEMREQESKWREEYEAERERLSAAYQARLSAEIEAARKVADEKRKNELLEQEIALQKHYVSTVQEAVETERSGRLARLDELSSSVSKLEKLTGEWNAVVDQTLKTQHLQVAVEALRSKVMDSETPTPFLNELVALKEISADDDVVSAAIASINPSAYQRGLPSPASLIDRFRRVASEVRKAALLPEDAGVASHAASAVLSRLMFQKKSDRGLPEGDDVEATLARTEVLLEEGALEEAAREMNGLRGWAGVLSRDWVGDVRRVVEVRQAVDVIAAEARLQSLLVD